MCYTKEFDWANHHLVQMVLVHHINNNINFGIVKFIGVFSKKLVIYIKVCIYIDVRFGLSVEEFVVISLLLVSVTVSLLVFVLPTSL